MSDKPSWLYNQSGLIPYRLSGDTPEILLINSRKRKRLVIPKGVIDPGNTPEESAINEALEEAGITGEIIGGEIGCYQYKKWGGTCTVAVYLFRVNRELDDWLEASFRTRYWMSVVKAAENVREPELKRLILSVPELLKTNQ